MGVRSKILKSTTATYTSFPFFDSDSEVKLISWRPLFYQTNTACRTSTYMLQGRFHKFKFSQTIWYIIMASLMSFKDNASNHSPKQWPSLTSRIDLCQRLSVLLFLLFFLFVYIFSCEIKCNIINWVENTVCNRQYIYIYRDYVHV